MSTPSTRAKEQTTPGNEKISVRTREAPVNSPGASPLEFAQSPAQSGSTQGGSSGWPAKFLWLMVIWLAMVLQVYLAVSSKTNQTACDCSSAVVLAMGGAEAVTYGGTTFIVADDNAANEFVSSLELCVHPFPRLQHVIARGPFH